MCRGVELRFLIFYLLPTRLEVNLNTVSFLSGISLFFVLQTVLGVTRIVTMLMWLTCSMSKTKIRITVNPFIKVRPTERLLPDSVVSHKAPFS